jgi:hypothetical protein
MFYAHNSDEAARQAGTYVSRRETLSRGELEESITILTASMVEATTLSEEVTLTSEGRPRLALSVRMTIDDSALRDLIDTLHDDQARIDEVEQLRHMNEQLRAQLRVTAATASTSASQALSGTSLALSPDRLTAGHSGRVSSGKKQGQAFLAAKLKLEQEEQALIQSGQLARQLTERLDVSLETIQYRDDRMLVTARVTGLGDYQQAIEKALGIRFNQEGRIGRQQLALMSPTERERFIAAFDALAATPLFLKVVAYQRNKETDTFDYASQLLVAPARRVLQGGGVQTLYPAPLTYDGIKRFNTATELPNGLALVLYREASTDQVTLEPNGDILVHLTLAAGGGAPDRLDVRVHHAPWATYDGFRVYPPSSG